jgi:hypothetical protein
MQASTPDEQLVAVAHALQGWGEGLSALGADEVLAWWTPQNQLAIAFRGDALRMERAALMPEEGIRNYEWHLDISLQHALGMHAKVVRQGMRAVGVSGDCGQLTSGDGIYIGELVDAIESAVGYALADEDGNMEWVRVALMPRQGSPWEFDENETRYYNARKRRWMTTPRPSWLIETTTRDDQGSDVPAVGADFCQIMGVVEGMAPKARALSMRFPALVEPDILVTHSLDFSRRGISTDDMAAFVNNCGGFLFPSIAVGHLPGAQFGPVCLVLDPSVVLEGMKPYRKALGNWPIVTYTTDAWTETMHGFLTVGSVTLFEQLTGSWSPGVYGRHHFWTLGPPVILDKGPTEAQLVLTTKKLRAEIRKRVRIWHRQLPVDAIDELSTSMETARYPYMEAKANSIVAVNNVAACVCPVDEADEVERFLGLIGFDGMLIPLDLTYNPMDNASIYAWSWAVQDAIRQLRGDRYIEVNT